MMKTRGHLPKEPAVAVGKAGPIVMQSPLKRDAALPSSGGHAYTEATESPRFKHRAPSPFSRSRPQDPSPPRADVTPHVLPPDQRSSCVNAPSRPAAGGVALFGAYHTTGKSLQSELAAFVGERAQRIRVASAAAPPRVATVVDRRPARSRGDSADGTVHGPNGHDVSGGLERESGGTGGVPLVAVNARLLAAPGTYGSYVLAERVRKLGGGRAGAGLVHAVSAAGAQGHADADKENNGRATRVRRAGGGGGRVASEAKVSSGDMGELIRQLGLSRETLDLVLPLRAAFRE